MLPLAVGGLNGKHFDRFSRILRKRGAPVLPYRSGSASGQTTPASSPLEPGDGFSASLSYGDLGLAAIGTTTATCGNLALAFGHPFFFSGPTKMGVNGANVLGIVKLDQYGGYKLANVTRLHGTMDQDRLLGVREIDGEMPGLTRVTAAITNTDLPKVRTGETDVVQGLDSPYASFADIATFSEVYEEDVAFDRIGDGSAALQWKIEGTGPTGEPFTLRREDKFYSPWDITFESAFELYGIVRALERQNFGTVTLTHVTETGTLTQDHQTLKITKVKSASSLQRHLEVRRRLSVSRGDTVRLQVYLRPAGSTQTQKVNLDVRVPHRLRSGSGYLYTRGGRPACGGGFFGGGGCDASSFNALLDKIANGNHYNDLVATLSMSGRTSGGGRRVHGSAVASRSDVISGYDFLRVRLRS